MACPCSTKATFLICIACRTLNKIYYQKGESPIDAAKREKLRCRKCLQTEFEES